MSNYNLTHLDELESESILFFEKFLPNLKIPASFSQEVKIPS